MSNSITLVSDQLASRFGLADGAAVVKTLAATAFRLRGGAIPSPEQITALMVVAQQYGLNPFTKELFAFPDKNSGAIIPVVSVDGWIRIINSHPKYDGEEFAYGPPVKKGIHLCHEWIECRLFRKDRSRPTVVREYLDEVYRPADKSPWLTHPKRMHRHKALIQAARLAFGFAGIYDADEAQRIVDAKGEDDAPHRSATAGPQARASAPKQTGDPIEGEVLPPESETPTETSAPPAGECTPPPAEAAQRISNGMLSTLKMFLAKTSAPRTEVELLGRFKVDCLESLTTLQINDAIDYAKGKKD